LKAAFLGQLVTDWLGDRGTPQDLRVSYRGIDVPGRPYRWPGRVTNVDGNQVELEVGVKTLTASARTVGSATVEMKS